MHLLLLFPPLLFASPVAVAAADLPKKPDGPTYQVPYRLTDTKHVLVRAKINGKGPFNFIVDTGAGALIVATAVGKKLGIETDDQGWAAFDRFEIEGGVAVEKPKARITDPFQLEGMNRLGLAGVELHGVIGYTVLARYRITFDFSKDKLAWTALAFDPPAPRGMGGKDAGIDALADLVKVMAALLGKQLERDNLFRGFLGVELADKDDAVVLTAVLPGSPAAAAKLKAGDRIDTINGTEVVKPADVLRLLATCPAGKTADIGIVRGGEKQTIQVTLGKGL